MFFFIRQFLNLAPNQLAGGKNERAPNAATYLPDVTQIHGAELSQLFAEAENMRDCTGCCFLGG